MGGFCLVTELARGGSASNGATVSSVLKYLRELHPDGELVPDVPYRYCVPEGAAP